jgi:hypothetical protein
MFVSCKKEYKTPYAVATPSGPAVKQYQRAPLNNDITHRDIRTDSCITALGPRHKHQSFVAVIST